MEIIIISILLLLNGLFAMFEIALVSSRKSRLQEKAKYGNKGAKTALLLLKEPEEILSAIQVGITLVGIVSGAFGGLALAEDMVPFFAVCLEVLEFLDCFVNSCAVELCDDWDCDGHWSSLSTRALTSFVALTSSRSISPRLRNTAGPRTRVWFGRSCPRESPRRFWLARPAASKTAAATLVWVM
jgi:hypothetical protein